MRTRRAVARFKDPATSHAAAAQVNASGTLNDSQRAVLMVLKRYGQCTHEELIRRYNMVLKAGGMRNFPAQTDQGIRSRCKALVDLGLVEDTGLKARISTGNRSIVWRAK